MAIYVPLNMNIQLHDKIFKPFLSEEEIQQRISEMRLQLEQDLAGLNPVFICVLNGAFWFTADLLRGFTFDYELAFTKLQSYEGTQSTGLVRMPLGWKIDLNNRHVIILEDVVDTGNTMNFLIERIEEEQPASMRVVTLLQKPNALEYNLQVDVVGFSIPNDFVVGYGLDYDGLGRNLKGIYSLV